MQIESKTKTQVEKELGTRIGKSIAKSGPSTATSATTPQPDKTTLDIPIEKIVRKKVLKAEWVESTMLRIAQQAILSSTLSSLSTAANLVPAILHV